MKKILLAVITVIMTIGAASAQQKMHVWLKDGSHVTYMVEFVDSLTFHAPTYTLAVAIEGEGTVMGAGDYQMDAVATLTATAASGYVFSRWSDGNTDNPRTITICQNVKLTAVFTETGSIGGIDEVIARYSDTIVMRTLMPGYKTYTVAIDNEVNGFIAKDTVFVGCIGETTLHITADQTNKKDVKLTVVPRLPEEFMFKVPNLDWTRNRAAVIKELGEPDNRIDLGTDSCYVYYSKDAAEPFIYYYFNGDTFDNLNEILVNISETDKEHGEVLKLFIAERYPFFGKGDMGGTPVWVYRNAANSKDADTQVLYYVKKGWNASFTPYSYGK